MHTDASRRSARQSVRSNIVLLVCRMQPHASNSCADMIHTD